MVQPQTLLVVFSVVLGCAELPRAFADDDCGSKARQERKDAGSTSHQRWIGYWELATEVNRILGFDDETPRLDAMYVHPISFQLTFDKSISLRASRDKPDATGISPLALEAFRNAELLPDGFRLVATGTWETVFEEDPGVDSNCFLVQHDGSTFLYCEAPYIGLYGGRVSFLQGFDHQHDLLVIDFNATVKNLTGEVRSHDTVAYRRSTKRTRNSGQSQSDPQEDDQ